jgi:hypothetical protein
MDGSIAGLTHITLGTEAPLGRKFATMSQAYLAERATRRSVPLGEMVNALLKQEIQVIESLK